MACELVWSIAQGIGRAIDATLFDALGALPASEWPIAATNLDANYSTGRASAQGIPFDALRAIVGSNGYGAKADQGALFVDGIPAENSPDTAATWLGAWSRAAVVIDPDILIVVTRMDASGALEAVVWLSTQALVPNPSMFWRAS